jgi:Cd2+/Zn2+-exporting ATPase
MTDCCHEHDGNDHPSPGETVPEPVPQGIVRTNVDAEGKTLTIDYDPSVISDASVREVAGRLAAPDRLDKCLMRLHGRACEACALHFERKAEAIPGIRRATATFIGGVMSVTFDDAVLTSEQVVSRVSSTGARVTPYTAEEPPARWISSEQLELVFTALCLVFTLAGWATRGSHSTISNGCFLIAYLTGGTFGVLASIQSLKEWTIDVDLLMVLAALGAAYVGAPLEGATLLFLFSFSNVLQAYAIDRTRRAIHSLMKLRPDKALVRRDGQTTLLPVEQLVVGDLVLVRPGESIPLDAEIVEGASAINEASLTGESMPVEKHEGDPVFAGTINQSGGVEVRVTKLAKDSTIEKLIRMVEEAQSEKAETQRFLDRAEQVYALGVILFTLGLILFPLLFSGQAFGSIFYRAMTVMVVASPCALIISTPASILSAIGGAARRGVLFKGGAHLEQTASVEVVAFDKTGTLTEGKPRLTDILVDGEACPLEPGGGTNGDLRALNLLELAACVEEKSEHPLAVAIVEEATRRNLTVGSCVEFQSVQGKGAVGTVQGRRIAIGSPRYLDALGVERCERTLRAVHDLQSAGKTCVLIAEVNSHAPGGKLLGAIAIADVLRETAPEVIRQLRDLGVKKVVMLTGDNERVAAAIARQAGVDEYHADLLPQDKVRVIRELKAIGPVAMVGDGVNDAPALAVAQVGVAMGAAGTDVAMETADVVLMSDNLRNVAFAISISRKARTIVWQNLAFAMAVIVVLVVSALGFQLPLPYGVVGHEGSTVLVCLNGLRLLAFRGRESA